MNALSIRHKLVEALEADLVGPFLPDGHSDAGQEILPIPPSRWYLTGFLAPQGGSTPEPEDADSEGALAAGNEVQTEDAGSQEPEAKRPLRFPASLGMSVFLPAGSGDALQAEISYADYEKIEVPLERDDRLHVGWRRIPRGPVRLTVPLERPILESPQGIPVPGSGGLFLRGELRQAELEGLPQGARVVSLFLVNGRKPRATDRDEQFVFQVQLSLHFAPGFLSRPNRVGEDAAEEDPRVLALMFRDRVEWAVGHNASVMPPTQEHSPALQSQGQARVSRLQTTWLPRTEVLGMRHTPLEDVETSMVALARLDGPGLLNALSPLTDAYRHWIDLQQSTDLPRESLRLTRDDLMHKASVACERMQEGISLLRDNPELRKAFQLANQVMHVAATKADERRKDRRYKGGAQPAWRPFQLAFVLMNLAPLSDPAHPNRRLAELIFFPTGGGKTEAYLGLIAFTLILRRLRGKGTEHEGRGVAVILRYTLRLLTLDQLDRAATLICALELLRSRNPAELGNARFSIGLWVGQSTTANRLKDVDRALHDFAPGQEESPFPLTQCPWCGSDIKSENIKLVDETGRPSRKQYVRAAVYCASAACAFTEQKMPGSGLPVLFVDEQIYQELPAFLVATVDKFAMLPWRGEAGMLFGRVSHLDDSRAYGVMHTPPPQARALTGRLLPPELIVQDELHLISGPLGTVVGLFEAAVDYLCELPVQGKSRPPKVICSTATVRRAREQIRALFGRDLALFPPRGINEGDNFFASLDRSKPGRLYVGVGAPGRALRAVSVRTYATLLASAQKHFEPKGPPDQAADPYMTLVGYFNSLRELGGMRRLVEDEVRTRVARFGSDKQPLLYLGTHPWAADRTLRLPAELTSRESTERVKGTRARLNARFAGTQQTDGQEPIDVVLASSMISVGLDIDRLGLMVVTGQPKTTSEYIQSTSRVGRAYPGLVVTCLNVMRPRDRSHFERFCVYHESLYRQVEATSITPFSGQTLDRALVAVLVSMIRHGVPGMAPPQGVMALHPHRPAAENVLSWLVERARLHRDWHDEEAEQRIAAQVRARGRHFLDAWERIVEKAAEAAVERTYSPYDRTGAQGKALLFTATSELPDDTDARQFEAPTSMRDVEPGVHVWIRFKPLDSRGT